jgi:hypothetical protein
MSARAFSGVFKREPGEPDRAPAAFEEGLRRLAGVVAEATALEDNWVGRVRRGLVALLGFIDDESGYGRLLFAREGLAPADVFACERRAQDLLLELLEDRPQHIRAVGEGLLAPRLTGELVVGGVFAAIRTHLLEGDAGSLVELAPSLLAFVVTPYLGQAIASADLAAHTDRRASSTTVFDHKTLARARDTSVRRTA